MSAAVTAAAHNGFDKKETKNTTNKYIKIKSHQPLVAGWFRMLSCSYTLPSFPRGGVYLSSYPLPEVLKTRFLFTLGLLVATFLPSW